ncbi:DUF2798 domain-containing protein [Calorimonas adulescens]|uniref:DUF2798 domain-containing protein n=2 Tax=Calorimonas adulescens TaxID=2606906 RepID=A0A5D8QCJ3_9THEO|nr:DUF2798 domain-containing protein [Calorimonas adulescens]
MLALGMTMSIVVQLLNTGKVALITFFIMTLESFVINFITALIIPANKFGNMFAKKCGAKENTLGFAALSNLIINGIYVTVISFTMTLINVGFVPGLFVAWCHVYPIVFVIGYIVSLAITPLAFKLTIKIVAK